MAPKDMEYIELAHKRAEEKKTHVSFPQLKYPSLRDEGLKDSVQWLAGKAMDDGADGLWRVHDKIYDFSSFLKRHPGGAEWLELTKGTDITESFESHHLNPEVEKMLDKFYVKDATTARNSPFTFKDDGFYRSLKRAVFEELKKYPIKGRTPADNITDGLLAAFLTTSALSCWLTNYWGVMAAYIASSFLLCWLTTAAHNYIHKKTNWRMYLFNLSLWSYREFRVSHVLSHHSYPNTLLDMEVSTFEPFVYWNPRKKPSVFVAFLNEVIFFPLVFAHHFVKRILLSVIEQDFFKKHYRWHDLFGLLLPLWMYFASGASAYDVFIMWLWIVCTSSAIFFHVGVNAAHHHPKIFKDGDQVDPTPDWGLHELEAVIDRKDINSNLFTVLTVFGEHALHHLFPTVDHSLLHKLHPIFAEHCNRFKGNFRVSDSYHMLIGQFEMLMKSDPSTIDEKKTL